MEIEQNFVNVAKSGSSEDRSRASFEVIARRMYREARTKMDQSFNEWLEGVWEGTTPLAPPDPPSEHERKAMASALDQRKADGSDLPQEGEGARE